MSDIIQTSEFDPLIPYITSINCGCGNGVRNGFPRLEMWLPGDFLFDEEKLRAYFIQFEVRLNWSDAITFEGTVIRPSQVVGFNIKGDLKDQKLGYYLLTKVMARK